MQQITPKLYIGDMQDALANSSFTNIDIIAYLGQDMPTKLCFNCIPLCIHFPLNDGTNGLTKIRKVLFTLYTLSLNNDTILIACRAGMSRSVVVTTALYALTQNISFDKAYTHIKNIRKQSQPELNLLQEVKKITEELRCCL